MTVTIETAIDTLPYVPKMGITFDQNITFEEWYAYGQHLWEIKQDLQWCIGDWLLYGEKRWGETYAQALSVTEYSEQTLKNLANVSKSFPKKKYRQQYRLSHSHFAAVAASDIPTAKKSEFLQAAVDNEMSREDVRAAVKSWRGEPEAVKPWVMLVTIEQQETEWKAIAVVTQTEARLNVPKWLVGQTVEIKMKVLNDEEL